MPGLACSNAATSARKISRLTGSVLAGSSLTVMVTTPPALSEEWPQALTPSASVVATKAAAVRSLAGALPPDEELPVTPPFVAPHHGVSAAALVGGGSGLARPRAGAH